MSKITISCFSIKQRLRCLLLGNVVVDEKKLYRNNHSTVWDFKIDRRKQDDYSMEFPSVFDFCDVFEKYLKTLDTKQALPVITFVLNEWIYRMSYMRGANWFAQRYRYIRSICIDEMGRPKSLDEVIEQVNELFKPTPTQKDKA